jgi:gamma-tubulin complex component 2
VSAACVLCAATDSVSPLSLSLCRYVDAIERAYAYASARLLEVLLSDKRLVDRLRSIKRYFLLEAGDVMDSFMDAAEDELRKPLVDVQPHKLEVLLDSAVRAKAAADPFRDDLTCYLQPYTLIQKLYAPRIAHTSLIECAPSV